MKIFLSHPLSGDKEKNLKENKKCIEMLEDLYPKNTIIISPLKLFNYIKEETEEQRTEIMNICKTLIEKSDLFVIPEKACETSKGCKEEYEYAEKLGKNVLILDTFGKEEKTLLDIVVETLGVEYGKEFKVKNLWLEEEYICKFIKEDEISLEEDMFEICFSEKGVDLDLVDECALLGSLITGKSVIVKGE